MKKGRSIPILAWAGAILAAGGVVSIALLATAPETKPEEKTRAVRIVQAITVTPRTEPISVSAQGPVIPAREVTIEPQVSGRIIEHHPALVPGGYIEAGEELIRIDPADYELALQEQQAAAEQAQFELALEQGRQVVASREWRLLQENLEGSEVNRGLVLREPHLRRAEAMIRMATNEIAKARLDLSRTTVEAPFNAMVLSESVETGQVVEPGTIVCTLAGTDEFWVQATLPVDKLRWIQLPGPGREGAAAEVILHMGSEPAVWKGRVVRLLGNLESTGLMARVLIEVKDPLGLRQSPPGVPLLLGSYVRVRIDAGELEDVLVIPRAALREQNRVWLVDENNKLQIREAEVLWTRQDSVLIANLLKPGERVIVSDLEAPLPGMNVEPRGTGEPKEPNSEPSPL